MGINCAHLNLLDCITDAVSNVVGSVLITCVGGLRHQHANITRGNWSIAQFQRERASLPITVSAGREDFPLTFWSSIEVEGIRTRPIFHLVFGSVWTRPSYADGIQRLLSLK